MKMPKPISYVTVLGNVFGRSLANRTWPAIYDKCLLSIVNISIF